MAYIDGCNFIEILSIGNAKASHPMLMTPFLEMTLVSPLPPTAMVSTYLTLEFLYKP